MLYIIVPVFNRVESTARFLKSLSNQKYKEYKVVIVDDGSTDGTANYLNKNHPDVHVVSGNGKLFWGGGINIGLEYLNSIIQNDDIIAFANNDIEFHSESIVNILGFYKKDKTCLYHPITLNEQMVCISAGAKVINWTIFRTYHPFRGKYYDLIKNNSPEQIDFATARFLLFDSKLLKIVSCIDTKNFLHYAGDNDFSMQLKLKGFPSYIIPSSFVLLDTSTTGNNPESIKSLSSFIKSLFSIKSTNNLKVRFALGNKYCPWFKLPFYYLAVILQVILLNLGTKE